LIQAADIPANDYAMRTTVYQLMSVSDFVACNGITGDKIAAI